jgi:hypothetical protein
VSTGAQLHSHTHTHTHTHTQQHAHTGSAPKAPQAIKDCLHNKLLQRVFNNDGTLAKDKILVTASVKGVNMEVQNYGNHLQAAFGYVMAHFTMKPYIYNQSFTAANGAGWYQAISSYGFAGIYKEAEDQTGDWRARQKASVAALVAVPKEAAGAAAVGGGGEAASGGGGGGGGSGGIME